MSKTNSVVMQTTKAINKKGKLKGKNKKETKVLRNACPHHRINKHGKLKSTIWTNESEYCVCTLCNKKFPAHFFKDEEIDTVVEGIEELNNQNKFTAVSTNAGEDAVKYYAQMGVMLGKYRKMSKKTKALAEKQNNVHKKKNKNRNTGSSMYGSWESSNGGRK